MCQLFQTYDLYDMIYVSIVSDKWPVQHDVCEFFQTNDLYDMMYMAITNDRVDFVKLFLDKGVGLREFLTVPRLLTLYNDVSLC